MESSPHPALAVCPECDWVMTLPQVETGEQAACPRCGHRIHGQPRIQYTLAWAGTALILLALAVVFPFVSFGVQGVHHTIVVADTAWSLFDFEFPLLGLLVLATTTVLPAMFLLLVCYLHAALALDRRPPWGRLMARLLTGVEPWLMSDVFVVGVLVALIKVLALAEVHLGIGFAIFCAYAMVLLQTIASLQPKALWGHIHPVAEPPADLTPGTIAAPQGAAGCARCGAIVALAQRARCPRCGRRTSAPQPRSLQTTWALILTAGILYIPAMAYPVMRLTEFGKLYPQTIVSGARYLLEHGSWPIAVVVFAASVVVPIGKVLALGWLCLRVRNGSARGARDRLRLYRLTEKIGRWSMIDVFVVALLAALIQAGQLMRVVPGVGAIAFAAVVILTMLAARVFDPRLIWRQPRETGHE